MAVPRTFRSQSRIRLYSSHSIQFSIRQSESWDFQRSSCFQNVTGAVIAKCVKYMRVLSYSAWPTRHCVTALYWSGNSLLLDSALANILCFCHAMLHSYSAIQTTRVRVLPTWPVFVSRGPYYLGFKEWKCFIICIYSMLPFSTPSITPLPSPLLEWCLVTGDLPVRKNEPCLRGQLELGVLS